MCIGIHACMRGRVYLGGASMYGREFVRTCLLFFCAQYVGMLLIDVVNCVIRTGCNQIEFIPRKRTRGT